jgi:hypothetical protein
MLMPLHVLLMIARWSRRFPRPSLLGRGWFGLGGFGVIVRGLVVVRNIHHRVATLNLQIRVNGKGPVNDDPLSFAQTC